MQVKQISTHTIINYSVDFFQTLLQGYPLAIIAPLKTMSYISYYVSRQEFHGKSIRDTLVNYSLICGEGTVMASSSAEYQISSICEGKSNLCSRRLVFQVKELLPMLLNQHLLYFYRSEKRSGLYCKNTVVMIYFFSPDQVFSLITLKTVRAFLQAQMVVISKQLALVEAIWLPQ